MAPDEQRSARWICSFDARAPSRVAAGLPRPGAARRGYSGVTPVHIAGPVLAIPNCTVAAARGRWKERDFMVQALRFTAFVVGATLVALSSPALSQLDLPRPSPAAK